MEVIFCIQDPTTTSTTYLYEAIIEAARGATKWRGVFAFASRDGVDWLIEEPVVQDLMQSGGEIDLLVGLDAITNRPTLERLREMEKAHPNLRPRVFWNTKTSLFHPKISEFSYPDGRRLLIVGSGNLTPGGLMNNIEAYARIAADPDDALDVSELDDFLFRHDEDIRSIDEEALARAEQNAMNRLSSLRGKRPVRLVPSDTSTHVAEVDRILIAQVPGAGGRWSQVHFNAEVMAEYFRVSDFASQRVFLTEIRPDGTESATEVRPVVYSPSNKNIKIEFGAALGKQYPASRPVLILRERRIRTFDYMLLFPDDGGYAEAMALTEQLPSVGRGLPRVIAGIGSLEKAWPQCPLLASEGVDELLV